MVWNGGGLMGEEGQMSYWKWKYDMMYLAIVQKLTTDIIF